ncbi:glycosyltransferase [Pontibacter silvestris]|uniref:Glycosyltransferase n=1 Tax=Pontibacter silvestris TaxID=2305183 RepID=A0ABW4X177_9BACT|nr:glycosyltransferase [Pontibacter silvestris]MCC9135510.1 glycosyltransferase [Pontibacter silvestris]
MNIVIIGLSITSSWGNGHATTYRGLVRELNKVGHNVLFLERDVAWYAGNRDLPNPQFCKTELYVSLEDLENRFTEHVREADMVIVGSYVPDGVQVGKWVIKTAKGIKAFYDIDTPVTLAKLERQDYEYLNPTLIPQYDLYLSFTGGPTLDLLEQKYGSPMARPLYCAVDQELYFPEYQETVWDLGYLGTYSEDRQPPLEKLMLDAARQWDRGRFVVVGPQYPKEIQWPANTAYSEHLPPLEHRRFYNSQRYTLNVTRADMVKAGYSPSVRLFEAAACGTPIISDYWDGLETIFELDKEILVAKSAKDTLCYLREMCKSQRKSIGELARQKVLSKHTAAHRAQELESYAHELMTINNDSLSTADGEGTAVKSFIS